MVFRSDSESSTWWLSDAERTLSPVSSPAKWVDACTSLPALSVGWYDDSSDSLAQCPVQRLCLLKVSNNYYGIASQQTQINGVGQV